MDVNIFIDICINFEFLAILHVKIWNDKDIMKNMITNLPFSSLKMKSAFSFPQNELSAYSDQNSFVCLKCAEGCDTCRDASPCVAALNWTMRTSILVLACAVIGFLPPAVWFTFRYQQVKVSTKQLNYLLNFWIYAVCIRSLDISLI